MQKGIGKRIRDARKAAGLTQEELAERMGTSSVAVAQWETGRRNPKMGTVSKLAAALGVDVAELVPELKTLLKEKPEPPKMEQIFEDACMDGSRVPVWRSVHRRAGSGAPGLQRGRGKGCLQMDLLGRR